MSRRSSRVKDRFDYREFGKSGRKVPIKVFENLSDSFSQLSIMDPNHMINEKVKLDLKFSR